MAELNKNSITRAKDESLLCINSEDPQPIHRSIHIHMELRVALPVSWKRESKALLIIVKLIFKLQHVIQFFTSFSFFFYGRQEGQVHPLVHTSSVIKGSWLFNSSIRYETNKWESSVDLVGPRPLLSSSELPIRSEIRSADVFGASGAQTMPSGRDLDCPVTMMTRDFNGNAIK